MDYPFAKRQGLYGIKPTVPYAVSKIWFTFKNTNMEWHPENRAAELTYLFRRQTPRHYVVTDTPERPRRAEEQYSYSYASEKSESMSSSSPYSTLPVRTYSSSSERVSRSTGSGPGSYSYSTERATRSSDYPGSYHSSYSSSTSGRLPHGTTYRHFSYRV